MACICAHSCNSWLTEDNLTEKGLRLEFVANITVVNINLGLLNEKIFEGNYR